MFLGVSLLTLLANLLYGEYSCLTTASWFKYHVRFHLRGGISVSLSASVILVVSVFHGKGKRTWISDVVYEKRSLFSERNKRSHQFGWRDIYLEIDNRVQQIVDFRFTSIHGSFRFFRKAFRLRFALITEGPLWKLRTTFAFRTYCAV